MASVNKVILLGNLGRDPEMRYTQGGVAVCTFPLATSRRWKDKATGEWQEKTAWHRVTCFNRLAENCAEFLKKGKPVYVEAELVYRDYEKDGRRVYVTDIVAQDVQFLGGGEGGRERDAYFEEMAGTYTDRHGQAGTGRDGGGAGDDDEPPF